VNCLSGAKCILLCGNGPCEFAECGNQGPMGGERDCPGTNAKVCGGPCPMPP
jgi:hypothetical protein